MDTRPNVLLVFFEGLTGTVIDSQVLDHARELGAAGIADFEIWAVAWGGPMLKRSRAEREAAEARAGCPIRVLEGVRPGAFASAARNGRRLWRQAAGLARPVTCIHARTDYAVVACRALARRTGARLIWDCRGDAAAEVEYRPGMASPAGRLVRPLLRASLRRRRADAAARCDRALFVSTVLCEAVRERLEGKPGYVIPSCASERLFFFDPELRRRTRRELGLADGQRVLLYSGGLQPYQRFPDLVEAFGRYRRQEPEAHLLVLTPARDEAVRRLSARLPEDGWQVRSAPLDEMNRYLNAADAAFLLRHPTPTNRAASPTKFAEYCLAGLPVIMTEAVPDAHRLAAGLGNLVRFDERAGCLEPLPRLDRAAIAVAGRRALGKSAFFRVYRDVYAP